MLANRQLISLSPSQNKKITQQIKILVDTKRNETSSLDLNFNVGKNKKIKLKFKVKHLKNTETVNAACNERFITMDLANSTFGYYNARKILIDQLILEYLHCVMNLGKYDRFFTLSSLVDELQNVKSWDAKEIMCIFKKYGFHKFAFSIIKKYSDIKKVNTRIAGDEVERFYFCGPTVITAIITKLSSINNDLE